MTSAEKLEVARALARLGVDVIEAGFPAASPDDYTAVLRIAEEVGNLTSGGSKPDRDPPVICGLARTTADDIEKAWDAIRVAAKPRLHTFLATSEIHMKHKLRMTPEEVVERVREMVGLARSLCEDVEFSPEDASRSDPAFLYTVLEEAIRAGATTLNIPDTVGYATPIQAGARQVEVTINGIGERAGNTSLEEVVMSLQTRHPLFGLKTGIDTTLISRTSKLVSNYTGMVVAPNKAIVGANAFAHEAGIHQDGMLKNNKTYEIMRPETVGLNQSRLVLGKHSGRHAFRVRIEELSYDLDEDGLERSFRRFKSLADKKKKVTDADIEALVADELYQPPEFFSLDGLQVACGTMGMPTATVRVRKPDDVLQIEAAVGTGPVDAAYKAIDQIIGGSYTLLEFSVHAVTEGIDAQGEVTVRIQKQREDSMKPLDNPLDSRTFGGYGADTDIIVASVKAYLAAINKLIGASGEIGEHTGVSEVRAPQASPLVNDGQSHE
jgi:2-isopropylmalate synthase